MWLRNRFLIVVAVLGLVAAACGGSGDSDAGGDDGGSDTTTTTVSENSGDNGGDTTTTSTPTDDGGSAPEVTEMGSFTVNDTEFAVTFLNRCIPFGGEDGVTIDLQPIAQGQGGQLNLYGTPESTEVSVQGSTITQMFGSIAFSAEPFGRGEISESSIDGDRWTGSATLEDVQGSADPVAVTWDVMIPPEAVDCSL